MTLYVIRPKHNEQDPINIVLCKSVVSEGKELISNWPIRFHETHGFSFLIGQFDINSFPSLTTDLQGTILLISSHFEHYRSMSMHAHASVVFEVTADFSSVGIFCDCEAFIDTIPQWPLLWFCVPQKLFRWVLPNSWSPPE